MSLDLYVDGPRWRSHLRATADAIPGLVPVAKGNGYGFGVSSLARRTAWLGCDTIAVGTYREVPEVIQRFDGDVLVLEPWRPHLANPAYGPRIIHTVGRIPDLQALGARDDTARVLLEGLTSMRRHGLTPSDLRAAAHAARGVRVEGCALHLPLGAGHQAEITSWLRVDLPTPPRWFVSHATGDEIASLRRAHPDRELRPRVGTSLWLGEPAALAVKATVEDVHRVRRGDQVGYRQRRVPTDGTVLVMSGGTAHGIGLEAPSAAASARQRARSLATGALDAVGRALSPFTVAGKQRWFVEPPHMQVSMVWLPKGVVPPAVGDLVDVQVRFTTACCDTVHLS